MWLMLAVQRDSGFGWARLAHTQLGACEQLLGSPHSQVVCLFFFFVLPSLRGLAPAPVQDAVKLSIQFPKPFSSACSVWCAITLLVIHVSVDLIHALTETGVTLVFCGVSER